MTAVGGSIPDGGFAPGTGGGGTYVIAPVVTIAAGNGLNRVANNVLNLDAGGVTACGKGVPWILSTNNAYAGGRFTAGNTYTVVPSTVGGLSGNYAGSFSPASGQDLAVPVDAVSQTSHGAASRTTAAAAANRNRTHRPSR